MAERSAVLWLLVLLIPSVIHMASGVDYCSAEKFEPSCPEGEVILMQSAIYGRMRISKCVDMDLGYLGCQADVLHIVDRHCSGRRSCQLTVPHADLNRASDCHKDIVQYLSAEYTCVKVVTPSQSKCTTAATIDASSRSGYLTSVTSSETGCGLAGAPWILETVAGQNISLTFLLFAWQPHNSDDTQHTRDCPVKYGYVIDLATQSTVELCGQAGLKRHQQQVLVNSNRLQIVVDRDHLDTGAFLIHYQVVGCADIIQPRHAWMHRDGDELVVGCRAANQQWHLTCRDNRWVGVIGNCTQYLHGPNRDATKTEPMTSFETSSAIVVVIVVALVLCVLIVTMGVLYLRRLSKEESQYPRQYQYPIMRRHDDELYNIKPDDQYRDTYSEKSNAYSRNQYTHIWDHPLMDDSQSETAFPPPPPPHSTPINADSHHAPGHMQHAPVHSTDLLLVGDRRAPHMSALRLVSSADTGAFLVESSDRSIAPD